MAHDQVITLIAALLGGLGIGSLITTVVTKWLEARSEHQRWLRDKKWECYSEIVRNLGEVHTLLSDMLRMDPTQPDYERDLEQRRAMLEDALLKSRQSGSVARLVVAPSVRTVLTRFGDAWNKSSTDHERGIAARWGWLVVTDIARNDLSGEPREMSDDFIGDVDVKLP